MIQRAIEVSNILQKQGKSVEIINSRFLKPLDNETILKSIKKTKRLITIEDNTLIGGLASSVEKLLIENKIDNLKFQAFGWKDEFIKHGKVEELEKLYGLDAENIVNKVNELF